MKYPKIKVKKSFSGLGIFAEQDIKKGDKILQYLGPKITNEQADNRPNRYIFYIDKKFSLDGSPRYNTARYFNHSCIPNAESIMEGDDRIFICAKKNIKSGNEITYNYGREYIKDYFKKDGCKCPKCAQIS